MKKGLEWLGKLTKEEQILFCKNRVNYKRPKDKANIATFMCYKLTIAQYLNTEFSSFTQFIDYAFSWEDTPEGHRYWADISKVI
jgi:hypothetical protein